ncbi:MAG: flagellar basal body rod protein FlgC [Candidatus Nealsonbacteria bacterium]|nr:flagellar basal body rod protein FlgC [Candidatus Nealsonbacteria bacterium]
MLTALDISTSGLAAQRIRMVTHANNLANISTTRNERGEAEPYQRRFVVFKTDDSVGTDGASGVKVSLVGTENKEPKWRPDPDHPDAVQSGPNAGNVAYPNISMMHEMTDAMEAARAYEANLGAIEISKNLAQQTLRILA